MSNGEEANPDESFNALMNILAIKSERESIISLLEPMIYCEVLGIPSDAAGIQFIISIGPNRVQQEIERVIEGGKTILREEFEDYLKDLNKRQAGKSITERILGISALDDLTEEQLKEFIRDVRTVADLAFTYPIYPDPKFFSTAKLPSKSLLLGCLPPSRTSEV